MIAVMYHYVRPLEKHLEYSHFMDLERFRRQLDYLTTGEGVLDRQHFLDIVKGKTKVPPKGFVLTFDDGLKDHYEYVLPELLRRNIWGIFFVPSGYYQTNKMLNVHSIHFLLGKHGGEKVYAKLENLISKHDIEKEYIIKFKKQAYTVHQQDSHETRVKRLINFYIKKDRLDEIIDDLADELNESLEVGKNYYLSTDQIKEMDQAGMIIGSHGITHNILSQLSPQEQEREISHSIEFVGQFTDKAAIRSFCYPHGQPFTYTNTTMDILKKHGCGFAFAVDARPIVDSDIASGALSLPRYDCNMIGM